MYKKGKEIVDEIFVYDELGNPVIGLSSSDFSVELKRNKENTSEIVSIEEKGNGYYYISFTPENTGIYDIKITCSYNQIGWTETYLVEEYSNADINTKLEELTEKIVRILGLVQENVHIDQQSYNSDGKLVSARIRIYSNPSSVGTEDDIVATYQMTAEYDVNNRLVSYRVIKV